MFFLFIMLHIFQFVLTMTFKQILFYCILFCLMYFYVILRAYHRMRFLWNLTVFLFYSWRIYYSKKIFFFAFDCFIEIIMIVPMKLIKIYWHKIYLLQSKDLWSNSCIKALKQGWPTNLKYKVTTLLKSNLSHNFLKRGFL